MGPYGSKARDYWRAGWHGVLPLPAGRKYPPPTGYTGRGAPYLSLADVGAFIEEHAAGNLCLRVPETVVGLDVDDYEGKPGLASLISMSADWGTLPLTWRSTARGVDNVSGIRFYRVPAGTYLKGAPAPGIEVVQATHRYAVVAPSINPKTGTAYRWYDPRGVECDEPKVDELPPLPQAWIDGLASAQPQTQAVQLGNDEVWAWLAAFADRGPACRPVTVTLDRYVVQLDEGTIARHDTALAALRALVAFGGEGHTGARAAILALFQTFERVVGAERGADEAEAEYNRMLTGAVRLAAAKDPQPRQACDCTTTVWVPPDVPAAPASATQEAQGDPDEPQAGRAPAAPQEGVQRRPPQFYGATEDGMARALVDYYSDRLRFVVDGNRSWLAWDGKRWVYDKPGTHRECIKELARGLPEDDAGWRGFKKRALGSGGVTGIAKMAESDRRLIVRTDQLDQDGWVLNTPAGIVDLRTGRTRPHDPAAMMTRTTPVAADFTGDRTEWLSFLEQTFGGDQELIGYLQRLVGYSAIGEVRDHVLPFCYGSGGNGKSVFLEVVARTLGLDEDGYATSTPNGFLMAKQQQTHETELARLLGRRLVLCTEVKPDASFDEERVKSLTGGDTITARFMHKDHITFPATHHLWLTGNDQPTVKSGGGRSFWRRLRLIPFLNEVPEDKIVVGLDRQLVDRQGAVILAWIIEGAIAYAERGLMTPTKVTAATEAYAEEQNQIRRFMHSEIRFGGAPVVKTSGRLIFEAYEKWCVEQGEQPQHTSAAVFARKFKAEAKVEGKPSNGQTYYEGVSLVDRSTDRGLFGLLPGGQ